MENGQDPGVWALLIGINQYPKFPPHNSLAGCVNDVLLVQDLLLKRFGFPQDRITLLTDANATRTAIVASLDAVVNRVKTDDVVVIYYAGHGSRRIATDRPTGKMETIVPYDSARGDDKNCDITEDELRLRLLRLAQRTRYTTLVFDCCHSETLIRDAFGDAARCIEEDSRILPPDDLTAEDRAQVLASRLPDAGPTLNDCYVVLAACREEEKAYEYRDGSAVHGAFSYFLLRELQEPTYGVRGWRQVFEKVAVKVSSVKPAQHPRSEGARDRIPFGREALPPLRTTAATILGSKRVSLQAGAAHGVRSGSQWDLFQAGVNDLAATIGRIQITDVFALESSAELISPALLSRGAVRAVEVARPQADTRWAIQLAPTLPAATAQALAEEIKHSKRLRLVANAEEATALIRSSVVDVEPMLAVVERTGQPLLRQFRYTELSVVMENLECLAHFQELLALDNPRTRIGSKIELRLLGQSASGSWYQRSAERCEYRLAEGERISFEIKNHHDRRLYVALFVFGIDRSISQVYPPSGSTSQPIEPEQIARTGSFRLRFPQSHALIPAADGALPRQGFDYVKAIVTTHAVDFEPLVHDGLRAGASGLDLSANTIQVSAPTASRGDWAVETVTLCVQRLSD